MSVHFIFGAPGSGKSSELLEEIISHAMANPGMSHLLLVPEQFCLSAQKRLMERHPRHAFMNIEALSFDRLAARAFREFSIEKKEILSETSKLMLLSLAMRDCEKKLTMYRRQIGRPAFIRKIAGLFSEWDMNDISPERLKEIAGEESLSDILKAKLTDLSRLYEAFKKRLGGSITAEELLPRFKKLLPASSVGRADRLYIDGFTGFTSVQYGIIEELMRRCPEVSISLTLPEGEDPDKEKPETASLFALSRSSYRRLVRCAEEVGKKSDCRFSAYAPEKDPERIFLRDNLFHHKPRQDWELPPAHISLTACETPADEAAFAAELIRMLCGKGQLHYRDIALVVGDLKEYVPHLKRLLTEAGIPFFTDRREALAGHPLVRLLGDSLEVISRGFERDAVLRVLKNPCSPLLREECDRFENYILAAGVRRGKAFTEPFSRIRKRKRGEEAEAYQTAAAAERDQMELLRLRALNPLIDLKTKLSGNITASEAASALSAYLKRLDCGQKGAEELPADQPEWQDVYEQIELLLENMAGIMGSIPVSPAGFADMLTVGLENLSQGRLPVSPDSVLIGDLERSRFGDIKILIFLGMNEGKVPRTAQGGQLITDAERMVLSRFEEDLAYTESRAIEEERYYLYSLLQKPEEHLYISFAKKGGGEESSLLPSYVIGELLQLYPKLPVRIYHKKEYLTTERRSAASALTARDPQTRSIPEAVAEVIYGQPLAGSVSSLERFASCPYAFFLERGLLLEEREERSWDSSDHGTLFHKLAESLLLHLSKCPCRPEEIGPAQKQQILEDVLREAEPLILEREWSSDGEKEYNIKRWRRFFALYLDYLCAQGLSDGFVPRQMETSFGQQQGEDTLIPLSREGLSLQLRGKIDRIDTKKTDEGEYLRVVDYKTRKDVSFSAGRLIDGRNLQLPLYLDIALRRWKKEKNREDIKPGGLLYASLAEQTVDWQESEEKLVRERYKKMALHGLSAQEAGRDEAPLPGTKVSSRELELTAAYARAKIKSLGDAITSGEILPCADADRERGNCAYCAYRAVCPFDERNPGCRFRGRDTSEKEAWEIIRKEGQDA